MVVPCYNERGNVERCIQEMKRFGTSTELIFVDDGSTDGTAAAVKPELNPDIDVRVISYTPNRGKSVAVQTGFDVAKNDIVLILDADLTTHPEELGPLYEAFAHGRAEFVNCTRLVYPMEGGAMKLANYVGNKLFTILVSFVMDARVSDTLCGTKAMFRRDYQHMIMGRDPWGDYDFLFGAAQQRLVIRELPVHYRERVAGLSKMNSTKHTINLLRMCWKGFWQVQTLAPIPAKQSMGTRSVPGRTRSLMLFPLPPALRRLHDHEILAVLGVLAPAPRPVVDGLRELHAAPLKHLHDHRLRVGHGSFWKVGVVYPVVIVPMLEGQRGTGPLDGGASRVVQDKATDEGQPVRLENAPELTQVVDDVLAEHVGENGLQQDAVDAAVLGGQSHILDLEGAARVVNLAEDVHPMEPKVGMPRSDVLPAPVDAGSNDVEPDV